MPSASGRRRPFRSAPPPFYVLYRAHHRLHANVGWAGIFILLLLLAMNHRHGWITR
jgi:hypothetical protein